LIELHPLRRTAAVALVSRLPRWAAKLFADVIATPNRIVAGK